MTRVWIINHYAIPPSESGGTRHYSLARELQKHGFEPTVIAAARNYQSGKVRAMPEGVSAHLEIFNNVPFLWMRTRARGKSNVARLMAMGMFTLKLMLNRPGRVLAKPDIIIGSSPDLFAAAGACFLARRLRVPFVLEVRDLWPESLIELTGQGPRHPLVLVLRFLERYVYRYAQGIVTLLSEAEPYFRAHGAHAPVMVIPNGIEATATEAPLPLPANAEFTVLYAGSHGIPNQLETLLHAAALLKNQPVHIILAGEGVRKTQLQEMAAEQGLRNVTFLPAVPKTEVAALLASADAFHLEFKDSPLYRWGVSPNKLYDYLLAARPVLYGANVGHNPVALADAGRVLPPGDAEALAAAIRELIAMPSDARAAMGQRGRYYVLAHHRFEHLGKRLAEFLRQLAR